MVFSSLFFIFFFLPIILIFYFFTKSDQLKNVILVFFSLIFYAWGEPIWFVLLIISAIVDYLNGIFVENNKDSKIAMLGVISTLIFNLGLLCTFKYADFFIENVNFLLGSSFKAPGLILPIGISFYTFQTISYTIDVYNGKVKAQRSFLNFLTFVTLFPQLVAGPIVRYSIIQNQLSKRQVSWDGFNKGVERFCKGLFKKVAIANTAGAIANQLLDKDIQSITFFGGWMGLIIFGLQVYYDFSGYSDMAIGLGKIFGFDFNENFNHPYTAKSITDFWRKWHMSLSTWLSDYIFTPIMIRFRDHRLASLIIATTTTFFVSGLWHGASWNFVLWGLYFGFWVLFESLFFAKILKRTPTVVQHVYFIALIIPSWMLFYYTDFNKIKILGATIFSFNNISADLESLLLIKENIFWLILAILFSLPTFKFLNGLVNKIKNNLVVNVLNTSITVMFFVISIILLVGSSYNPFLYFRF
jgi:alginate O-acetyltransferase complex protein AlgI